jgi:hypothetical protein
MKRFTGFFSLGVVLGLVFANLNWDYPRVNVAHASERSVCGITLPLDGGNVSTDNPTWGFLLDAGTSLDGGSNTPLYSCPWSAGAVVGLQCSQSVFYDPCRSDTANVSGDSCGSVRGQADPYDTSVDFVTYKDPYKIELRGTERELRVQAGAPGTASDAGWCVFSTTLKKNGGL